MTKLSSKEHIWKAYAEPSVWLQHHWNYLLRMPNISYIFSWIEKRFLSILTQSSSFSFKNSFKINLLRSSFCHQDRTCDQWKWTHSRTHSTNKLFIHFAIYLCIVLSCMILMHSCMICIYLCNLYLYAILLLSRK